MELRNQPPSSHPLTAPVHPPERVTGPLELHHSEGRYLLGGSTLGGHDDPFACIYPFKQHGELCLVCADGDVHAG